MFSSLVEVNPVVLNPAAGIHRNPPRPIEQRQADYEEKFDYDTLFYDIFRDGDKIRFAGPPLLNLQEYLSAARVVDSKGRASDVRLGDLDRTQHSWTDASGLRGSLTFESNLINQNLTIGASFTRKFSKKRVLVTKSQNNQLSWIRDWVRFHQYSQDINAVVIYDNNSTLYSPQSVLKTLKQIRGLDSAIVVPWPFKFGPQGGNWQGMKNAPWDSDFTEYGILEHARYRFLQDAEVVISCDIDELVMSENGETISSILQKSSSAGVEYRGRWIESVCLNQANSGSIPNFSDFYVFDKNRYPTTRKWAISPSRTASAEQWKTHSIAGASLEPTNQVMHRHFMAISSNWKTQRTDLKKFDASKHRIDQPLINAMLASGIMSAEPSYLDVAKQSSRDSGTTKTGAAHPLERVRDSATAFAFTFPCSRLWFYNENCLTFDTVLNGYFVGFDFVLVENRIEVKAVGRDAKSVEFLASVFSCRGLTARSSKGHYLAATFTSEIDPTKLISKFAGQVEWMLHRASSRIYNAADKRPSQGKSLPLIDSTNGKNSNLRVGAFIAESISGARTFSAAVSNPVQPKLFVDGSMLNAMGQSGTEFWGTGLQAPLSNAETEYLRKLKPRTIHAVRGEATYRELSNVLGWNVPSIFGDPGLLLPRFCTAVDQGPSGALVIIGDRDTPRLHGVREWFDSTNLHAPVQDVVNKVSNATHVVSSSLQGLLLAQAYGVPWTWIRFEDDLTQVGEFEFEDFFSLLDRSKLSEISVTTSEVSVTDVQTAIDSASLPSNKFSFNRLLDAFPHGLAE